MRLKAGCSTLVGNRLTDRNSLLFLSNSLHCQLHLVSGRSLFLHSCVWPGRHDANAKMIGVHIWTWGVWSKNQKAIKSFFWFIAHLARGLVYLWGLLNASACCAVVLCAGSAGNEAVGSHNQPFVLSVVRVVQIKTPAAIKNCNPKSAPNRSFWND